MIYHALQQTRRSFRKFVFEILENSFCFLQCYQKDTAKTIKMFVLYILGIRSDGKVFSLPSLDGH